MKVKFLMIYLLISFSSFGQEIGNIKNGNHTIKLLKSDNLFSFVYSDVNSKASNSENSFNFPNIDTIYTIVMDGFNYSKNHQIIVQISSDTIVKFEFKKIRGKKMLMIKQNNLANKTFSTSSLFTQDEIKKLFGNP